MGTAERRRTPGDGERVHPAVRPGPEAPDRDIPAAPRKGPAVRADAGEFAEEYAGVTGDGTDGAADAAGEGGEPQAAYRPLWKEEPARRRRLPDPVRTAAVRAVLIVAVTLIQAMVAFLCTLAGSWLAFPMVIGSIAGTVVATWAVLDVWVTRQVWNQRHGVVSMPSSTARALRRERRRARRQARIAERAQERIRRRGGTGQLSHS
ncbi:hypothetical protein AB0L35_12030 [Streptomyces sp. NPDC052309]|uniref:hypothetical protein n=1 Tax=Streptomyces sp. NPDC052309 TaxID=3155421 RepID=UPI0034356355